MTRLLPGRGERGLSLIEIMVTLLLATIVAAIFFELVIGAMRVGMLAEGANDLSAAGQKAVNGIQTEIIQSKLILEEDSIGSGYRTLFTNALPSWASVWTNSRMPIIDTNTTTIGPDPGPNSIANRTGNSIIVVRQLSPVNISYDHDANAGTANINFLADRYQFQYYFIDQNTAQSFNRLGYYLDLVQVKSQIFADYFQLGGVTVNQSQLVTGLRALTPAITMAWDPGKAVSAPAFYNLNSGGTISANASPTFTVTAKSLLPEFSGGRVSGNIKYSLAFNSGSPPTFKDPVPRYATANSNFPGGMEFMVVGARGSRKVMTRLVLATESRGNIASKEALVLTSGRSF